MDSVLKPNEETDDKIQHLNYSPRLRRCNAIGSAEATQYYVVASHSISQVNKKKHPENCHQTRIDVPNRPPKATKYLSFAQIGHQRGAQNTSTSRPVSVISVASPPTTRPASQSAVSAPSVAAPRPPPHRRRRVVSPVGPLCAVPSGRRRVLPGVRSVTTAQQNATSGTGITLPATLPAQRAVCMAHDDPPRANRIIAGSGRGPGRDGIWPMERGYG